jgi:hypothetical protein
MLRVASVMFGIVRVCRGNFENKSNCLNWKVFVHVNRTCKPELSESYFPIKAIALILEISTIHSNYPEHNRGYA